MYRYYYLKVVVVDENSEIQMAPTEMFAPGPHVPLGSPERAVREGFVNVDEFMCSLCNNNKNIQFKVDLKTSVKTYNLLSLTKYFMK